MIVSESLFCTLARICRQSSHGDPQSLNLHAKLVDFVVQLLNQVSLVILDWSHLVDIVLGVASSMDVMLLAFRIGPSLLFVDWRFVFDLCVFLLGIAGHLLLSLRCTLLPNGRILLDEDKLLIGVHVGKVDIQFSVANSMSDLLLDDRWYRPLVGI